MYPCIHNRTGVHIVFLGIDEFRNNEPKSLFQHAVNFFFSFANLITLSKLY